MNITQNDLFLIFSQAHNFDSQLANRFPTKVENEEANQTIRIDEYTSYVESDFTTEIDNTDKKRNVSIGLSNLLGYYVAHVKRIDMALEGDAKKEALKTLLKIRNRISAKYDIKTDVLDVLASPKLTYDEKVEMFPKSQDGELNYNKVGKYFVNKPGKNELIIKNGTDGYSKAKENLANLKTSMDNTFEKMAPVSYYAKNQKVQEYIDKVVKSISTYRTTIDKILDFDIKAEGKKHVDEILEKVGKNFNLSKEEFDIVTKPGFKKDEKDYLLSKMPEYLEYKKKVDEYKQTQEYKDKISTIKYDQYGSPIFLSERQVLDEKFEFVPYPSLKDYHKIIVEKVENKSGKVTEEFINNYNAPRAFTNLLYDNKGKNTLSDEYFYEMVSEDIDTAVSLTKQDSINQEPNKYRIASVFAEYSALKSYLNRKLNLEKDETVKTNLASLYEEKDKAIKDKFAKLGFKPEEIDVLSSNNTHLALIEKFDIKLKNENNKGFAFRINPNEEALYKATANQALKVLDEIDKVNEKIEDDPKRVLFDKKFFDKHYQRLSKKQINVNDEEGAFYKRISTLLKEIDNKLKDYNPDSAENNINNNQEEIQEDLNVIDTSNKQDDNIVIDAKPQKKSSFTLPEKMASKTLQAYMLMKEKIANRTWGDIFGHPFRSIMENITLSKCKSALADRYDIKDDALIAIDNWNIDKKVPQDFGVMTVDGKAMFKTPSKEAVAREKDNYLKEHPEYKKIDKETTSTLQNKLDKETTSISIDNNSSRVQNDLSNDNIKLNESIDDRNVINTSRK